MQRRQAVNCSHVLHHITRWSVNGPPPLCSHDALCFSKYKYWCFCIFISASVGVTRLKGKTRTAACLNCFLCRASWMILRLCLWSHVTGVIVCLRGTQLKFNHIRLVGHFALLDSRGFSSLCHPLTLKCFSAFDYGSASTAVCCLLLMQLKSSQDVGSILQLDGGLLCSLCLSFLISLLPTASCEQRADVGSWNPRLRLNKIDVYSFIRWIISHKSPRTLWEKCNWNKMRQKIN